jgi:hypothetical protein
LTAEQVREAVAFLANGSILNRISRHNADEFAEAVATTVEAARRWADYQDDQKTWPFCPICGRRNRGAALPDAVEAMGDTLADWTFCSPTNCDAWKVTATFDHATREWVPVDTGGTP